MKKNIIFSIILLLLFAGLIYISFKSSARKDIDTNSNTIELPNCVNKIDIIKSGNPVTNRTITDNNEINNITSLISSIPINKPIEDVYKGWKLRIKIYGSSNKAIEFSNDKIHYEGKWYNMDSKYFEKLQQFI